MRKILIFLALIIALPAHSEVIRDGDTVILRATCLVLNIGELDQAIPQGVTTLEQMAMIIVSKMRPLTPAEEALCHGTTVQEPGWRVHNNGNATRPAYTYEGAILTKHETARATVGEVCRDFVNVVSNSIKLEYRTLARDPTVAAVCEFRY